MPVDHANRYANFLGHLFLRNGRVIINLVEYFTGYFLIGHITFTDTAHSIIEQVTWVRCYINMIVRGNGSAAFQIGEGAGSLGVYSADWFAQVDTDKIFPLGNGAKAPVCMSAVERKVLLIVQFCYFRFFKLCFRQFRLPYPLCERSDPKSLLFFSWVDAMTRIRVAISFGRK